MKRLPIALVLAGLAGPALAQIPVAPMPLYYVPSIPARIEGMPRDLPRAKGPGLDYSIQLARAAVAACKAKGGDVSVLVTDSVGVPVVLLSGDGAGERSMLITSTKAHAVVKYRMESGAVSAKARADAKLKADIADNPNIGVVRGGAFPLMKGTELIGALSVSGFTGQDEACAQEAMTKVAMP